MFFKLLFLYIFLNDDDDDDDDDDDGGCMMMMMMMMMTGYLGPKILTDGNICCNAAIG